MGISENSLKTAMDMKYGLCWHIEAAQVLSLSLGLKDKGVENLNAAEGNTVCKID